MKLHSLAMQNASTRKPQATIKYYFAKKNGINMIQPRTTTQKNKKNTFSPLFNTKNTITDRTMRK